MAFDANRNTPASLVDDTYPDGACFCCEYLLVFGGHDGLRLLQLLGISHVVPQSWNQLLVYNMVRRAAVHNHRKPVGVGVKNPFSRCQLAVL